MDISTLFTGQYKILMWFIVFIIFIYIPTFVFYLYRRRKREEGYKFTHPDAVTVKIARSTINDTLTVHSIDNEKPVFFSKGTHMYFYITPGEHILSLSYQWVKVSITAVSGYEDFYAEDMNITVKVDYATNYQVRYDYDLSKYCFEIIN